MKTRLGFVSNSSSSCFILKWSDLTQKEKKQIKKLHEYSGSLGRGTGYIAPDCLEGWLKELDEIYKGENEFGLKQLIAEHRIDGENDIFLVRKSDEDGMEISKEYEKNVGDIVDKHQIGEFEYH